MIEIPSREAVDDEQNPDWPDPVPYFEFSERQQEILQFLWNRLSPYPPSFREIGTAVGLTGPSAVRYQIDELQAKGWVRRHPRRPRALEVRQRNGQLPVRPELPGTNYRPVPPWGLSPQALVRPCRSGTTIGSCPWSLSAADNYSSLRVRGDSMIDAAILDGDWVAVRQQTTAENGEIVVAMIDGQATVKTLRCANGPGLADATEPRVRADSCRERHSSWQGG